ncbi:MAG: hypothetical protein HZB59_05615 [Ignavibacteriales bacterium]|nr:hypothetical protein [Ignavibacteriales bacterium]
MDTLTFPGSAQILMEDIWGSTPIDVYTVGHNDQGGAGAMFHFNGSRWSAVPLHYSEGGKIKHGFDLHGIYGFSSVDIYAVGSYGYTNPSPPPNFLDSSMIIHFDGIFWRDVPIERKRGLKTIWGSNRHDVWAGGRNGALYHLKNGDWSRVSFDTTLDIASISGLSSNDVYMVARKEIGEEFWGDSTYHALYHYDGEHWNMIDSFIETSNTEIKFGWNLWACNTQQLYSAGQNVWSYDGNLWKTILSYYRSIRISGSSEKNIFAISAYEAFHWNGIDWENIYKLKNNTTTTMRKAWTNGVETFILSDNGWATYIIHGR